MPSRRETIIGAGVTVLLNACGESIIFQKEQAKRKENISRVPEPGDVVFNKDAKPYLLRSNIGMRVLDLRKYLPNSKAKDYGREVFDSLSEYVREDIFDRFAPHEKIDVLNIFDQFSGQLRRGKPFGGESLVLWDGMLTHRGFPLDVVNLDNDPFVHVRRRLMPKPLNWQLYDSNFFTHNAFGLSEYKRRDTLRPVPEIIRDAISFIDILRNWQPFEQFNFITHSLGGIPAVFAAMRNMDIMNNLILISCPIRGLDSSNVLEGAVERFGENLLSYLFKIRDDPNYQKDLDKFGRTFTSKGRKITIIVHEKDPIATTENAMIEGATLVVIKGGIFGGFLNPLQGWEAHGAGIGNKLALDVIAEKIGQNLAA